MAAAGIDRAQRAARWLLRQHLDRARSRPMPASMAPRSMEDAYGVQEAFVALKARAWVANHLARRGRKLRKGDVVITGSLVTSKLPRAGNLVRFEAGPLGVIELRVT